MRVLRGSYFLFLIVIFTFSKSPSELALNAEINWISFEEAVARTEKNPKMILIDLYTDWCGWCKKMDRDTYSRSEIVAYVNEKFYAVKFNAEGFEDVNFRGYTFKFVPSGRKGYHELAAALTQNKLSYPTTVFMNEELQIIQPVPGYLDAPTFDVISRYMGEGKYKNTSWEDFQKFYQSKL
ncbi:MAG: thioredoxin [Flammeovirgaceae bacterium]|nr:thioredoxin [Flammeovirgaceae bacterium]